MVTCDDLIEVALEVANEAGIYVDRDNLAHLNLEELLDRIMYYEDVAKADINYSRKQQEKIVAAWNESINKMCTDCSVDRLTAIRWDMQAYSEDLDMQLSWDQYLYYNRIDYMDNPFILTDAA